MERMTSPAYEICEMENNPCSKRSKPPTSYSCMMLYVDQVTIEILDLPIQNGWSFYSSLYDQVTTM
jgi:hypothetical protein